MPLRASTKSNIYVCKCYCYSKVLLVDTLLDLEITLSKPVYDGTSTEKQKIQSAHLRAPIFPKFKK
jgi:hypothetical protein